jgi:hypothetical protein
MAENVEIDKAITTHYVVDSQKFNQKEVTDQSASDDFGITPSMVDNQMIEEHVEVVLPTMGDHRMIGEHAEVVHEGMVRGTDRSAKRLKPNNDDGYRKYREFVEVAEELPCKRKNARPGIARTPLEIDPFSKSDMKDKVYMETKLTLWCPYWSDNLQNWNSTYNLRRCGTHGDKYWYPPNTLVSSTGKIRSKPDLASFLDFCVTIDINQSNVSRYDNASIIELWARQKKEQKVDLRSRAKGKKYGKKDT